ncbi:hypothetical protein Cgig2_021147 [Carnegiea gigantea]|uniref:Uncharacterized protein n=1 Tax=Carnegiea gigantea TaxID=171969 RepID=A0A9Q1QSH2_9CARY|nr:hypothetical protein Cgig2_021147 [Carnegiea gigantea]
MLCDLGIFDGIEIALPSVVKACGRLKHAREGQQVHEQILQTHVKLDPFVLNALIRMYSELGGHDKCLRKCLTEMLFLRTLCSCDSSTLDVFYPKISTPQFNSIRDVFYLLKFVSFDIEKQNWLQEESDLKVKIKQLKSENNCWHQYEANNTQIKFRLQVNLEQRISQLLHEKASLSSEEERVRHMEKEKALLVKEEVTDHLS